MDLTVATRYSCSFFILSSLFMSFFKDAIREFKHVVWPTAAETRQYFLVVLTVLVLFGLYIFIASSAFTSLLIYLKEMVS